MKLAVPILPGPIVKDAETSIALRNHKFRLEHFRSVVRLYQLDKVPTVLREWCDTPSGVFEPFGSIANGEFQIVLIGGRVLPCLEDGSFVNTPVKSGAELIDHLAEFERKVR